MTTLTILVTIALAGLLGWGLVIGFADAMLKRRHEQLLDLRDWQEKVDAMRRLQDREGDA